MKTLKEQLVESGLARDTTAGHKNVGEVLVTGEVEVHRRDVIGSLYKSLYKAPTKFYDHRERHGRVRKVEVKKIMEEKKIDRKTIAYLLITLMKKLNTPMTGKEILTACNTQSLEKGEPQRNQGSLQQGVYTLHKAGALIAKDEKGEERKYVIKNPLLTADEIYIQFVEWNRSQNNAAHHQRVEKKKAEKVEEQVTLKKEIAAPTAEPEPAPEFAAKEIIAALRGLIPENININVNHRIEVVFTINKKGGEGSN